MASQVKPVPEGYRSITPYLTVKDAVRAVEFYQKAFSAEVLCRIDMPDGRIGHVELKLGDSMIMLCDEFPQMGNKGPLARGGTPVMIHFYTANVDDVFRRALEAGATVKRPVQDQFYGDRSGGLVDPFGHEWFISTHIEDISDDEMQRRSLEYLKAAKETA